MRRVAIVTSHPIQYQAPWFRALAGVCDVSVFFCHRQDGAGQARAGFGRAFEWDVPLLDGYPHEWLKNVSTDPGVDGFAGCDTPEIRDRLAAGRFDACIVNGWYLKSYVQALNACRRLQIPVLVRGDSHLKTPRSRTKTLIKYVPFRWLLASIDAHLYVGQANREYLQHYGVRRDRLFFAPHFVENDRFAADAERARRSGQVQRLRTAWGAADTTHVFLFAGKFIEKKRPADFIDAIAVAAATGLDVRGVLVGSGPEESALRERAAAMKAPIAFDGFQNQTHIGARYAAANCLVLPSDGRETWGLVVNEAMATGRPAIVSDAVGCVPDLIVPGQTGAVFPVGSVPELAECMRKLIPLLRNEDGTTRAVRTHIGRYTCAEAVAGTMKAIESVTNERRRESSAIEQHA